MALIMRIKNIAMTIAMKMISSDWNTTLAGSGAMFHTPTAVGALSHNDISNEIGDSVITGSAVGVGGMPFNFCLL